MAVTVSEQWQVSVDDESAAFYAECAELHTNVCQLMKILRELLFILKAKEDAVPDQYLESTVELFQSVTESFTSLHGRVLAHEAPVSAQPVRYSADDRETGELSYTLSPVARLPSPGRHALARFKTRRWRERIWRDKATLCFTVHQLVNDLLDVIGEKSELRYAFLLASLFNDLMSLESSDDQGIATSCKNTCPILLYPLRKLSVTRLLQIIGQQRAEAACHSLAEALLFNYQRHTESGPGKHRHMGRGTTYVLTKGASAEAPPENYEEASSSENGNSSIEVYRALAGHISPPCGVSAMPPVEKTAAWLKKSEMARLDWAPIEQLVAEEQKHATTVLNVAAQTTPLLLGRNGVKISKNSGLAKVVHGTRTKAVDYFQQVVWAEAGTYMEHHVLWWSTVPFGTLAPDESKKLRLWLLNLSISGCLPALVAPAIHNLADGLGCHVTATKWDQLFRHTQVHGQRQGSQDQNKDVGQLFNSLLQSLVTLSNDCETTVDWISSPPLEELPLVEQIPILHRLDHSVHTTRLWAANKAKTLINTWKVDKFFNVSQTEVQNCLTELQHLQFASHLDLSKVESQHVLVCAKMRTKLTAEVNENIAKLKKLPSECIEVMASVCRTYCLADLSMSFPEHRYWRRSGPIPDTASGYVAKYLDHVLKPVLDSLSPLPIQLQQSIAGMTLRILCEAWLDHIYTHRIKFSEWGALQLLADFGGVPKWLDTRGAHLPAAVEQTLRGHEVLRRCEGVGKLLLRKPGESLNMMRQPAIKHNQVGVNGTSQQEPSSSLDLLPPEMFVPNQQQWLELRAPKQRAFSLCCSS